MIRRYIIWRNNHAYDEKLRRIVDRLRPGGVFALWSDAPPDDAFGAVLTDVFAAANDNLPGAPTPDAAAATLSVDAHRHWVHTGVHRLCTAGERSCRAPRRAVRCSTSLQLSALFEREDGWFGGRLTDGVGPRVMTLTSNAERRRR